MKIKPLIPLAITLTLVITGCGGSGATKEQYTAMIDQAKAAYSKVDKTGFAWTQAKEMIGKAEAAAQGGDYDKAYKEAKASLEQSEAAWQQYLDNKDADQKVQL